MSLSAFDEAWDAIAAGIAAGIAESHPFWCILTDEHERDDFLLRPLRWEGRGEYQRVRFADGRDVLVRLPYACVLS
ncbi:hypothetical protein AVMA1855_02790 [Acidovorax sp. SUPP1855]|uniref:hypothetical protein n=1 Tax=Acidovorax sp. SUPP1855 TaxID=431774 RepID=UPI0023DE2D10|nr:hypothetical protein [Acidovorax sp. SUPP1855]GKS83032.1 hypothetical protein AVMA1855_02790 [Acidovorax sp. SUPP1855]